MRVEREKERKREEAERIRRERLGITTRMGMQYEQRDEPKEGEPAEAGGDASAVPDPAPSPHQVPGRLAAATPLPSPFVPSTPTLPAGMAPPAPAPSPIPAASELGDPEVTAALGPFTLPNSIERAAGFFSPILPPSSATIQPAEFASAAAAAPPPARDPLLPISYVPLPLVSFYMAIRPSAETLIGAAVASITPGSKKKKDDDHPPPIRTKDVAASCDVPPAPTDAAAAAAAERREAELTSSLDGARKIGGPVIGGSSGDCFLLAAFDPNATRQAIAEELVKITDWIKREAESLFFKKSATW
jgi:hypothetical protein